MRTGRTGTWWSERKPGPRADGRRDGATRLDRLLRIGKKKNMFR
jgi:hypothetical protein